ncbi:hypothetical protein FRB96_005232 [Tulasnella sp. 330]|nr:hypothetical protein FRB96_005232 [Tulasnella sp. 330]
MGEYTNAIGSVNQHLWIGGVPKGVTMTVTDIQLHKPSGGGQRWPTFSGDGELKSVSLYPNTKEEDRKHMFPAVVGPAADPVKLGVVGLTTQSITDSGEGPRVEISFKLEGTATVDGKGTTAVNHTGFITVSSSNWPYLGRPDFCNITYQLVDTAPLNLPNQIPTLVTPDGAILVFGIDPSVGKLGMNASVDSDAIKSIIELALKGIFLVHEKAIGWVFGKVL